MKHNISLIWFLFDGHGGTSVIVSPTLGNFVPKFIRRSLYVTLCQITTRDMQGKNPVISLTYILQKRK
ncbi:hypothetical protein Hanom_Chr00s000004g01609781 [Helianthus anomalus]